MNSEDYKNAAELITAIERIAGAINKNPLKIVRDALKKEVAYRTRISGTKNNHVIFYQNMLEFINSKITSDSYEDKNDD